MRRLLLIALLVAYPAAGQGILHRFTVPDPTAKLVAWVPAVSEYPAFEEYDQWWHEIAACEGLPLPPAYRSIHFVEINAVHFYDSDHPDLFWKDGVLMVHWAIAQSNLDEGVIFVSIAHRGDPLTMKHEMLHFLLYWAGIPPGADQHPMPYFGRCGITVTYESKAG